MTKSITPQSTVSDELLFAWTSVGDCRYYPQFVNVSRKGGQVVISVRSLEDVTGEHPKTGAYATAVLPDVEVTRLARTLEPVSPPPKLELSETGKAELDALRDATAGPSVTTLVGSPPQEGLVERLKLAIVTALNEQSCGSCREASSAAPGNFWYGGLLINIGALAHDAYQVVAAELTRISADNARLRELLKPFALAADDLDDAHGDHSELWEDPAAMSITAGNLRDARAALQSKDKANG